MISKLTNWVRRQFTLGTQGPDDDFWYGPVGQPMVPGLPRVSQATSPTCVGVYTCVRVISDTVSTLPLQVFQRVPGGKELVPEHPNYSILHGSTSEEMTSVEWLCSVMEDILTAGFHLSRVILRSKDFVREIVPLDTSEIQIKRDKTTGIRFFEWRPDGQAQPVVLFDDDVLFIPGPWITKGKPVSPIDLVAEAVALAMSAQQYGARFFGQGASPRIYGSIPHALTKPVREELHEYVNGKLGGLRNAHKIAVMDNGFELKTIPVNHRDLQFIELRKFQLEEICRIYRVPLHLAGSLDRATFSNIEHQDIEFAKHCIRPWLVRLEARINRTLFGPIEGRTFFAEFNMDALFRGDTKSRAELYASGINNAWMKPNEVRAKENLNPVEGGDQLFIQGATVPISQAGETQNSEVSNA